MPKRYSTPHRNRIIKTRMTEEEHADFMERLTAYGMSQSEFIRQAITGVTVKPKLPSAKVLTAEIDELMSEKNAGYTEYQEKKQRANELLTIKRNIDQVLYGAPSQRRDEHGR